MSRANALQDSNSKVIETTFQPALIVGTSEKKDCLRVLHVDDDQGLLEVSKQILLMENNFEIENAFSVDEAFEKLEKQTYDAIVSDYEMPRKNGLEFLRELREQHRETPFILFTGKGREDVAVKALNLGADSYINKAGSPETVYCELADAINKTVERKKSRELLAKSESKYHALVENSLQGIAILLAAPIRIAFANGAFGKILGYSSEELTSLSPEEIMSLVYHEDRAVFFKRMENRLRGEPAEACFEFRAVRKDGSLIWLSSLANRVDYDGQPAVQGMFLDISERKKAEEVVKKSETRYRELANFLPEIVFETDLSGKITFLSQRAFEITGFTPEEQEKGINMLQFVVPEDRERAKENIRRRMAGEKSDTSEYTLFRKNGETYPVIVKTAPIYYENRLTGLRGLVIDITDRKKVEEASKKQASLIDLSPDAIIVKNMDETITFWNTGAEKLYGYTKQEALGQKISILLKAKHSQSSEEVITQLRQGKSWIGEITHYNKNNNEVRVQSYWSATLDAQGDIAEILESNVDITERKKTEETLKESEEKYQTTFEMSMDALMLLDEKSFLDCNRSTLQLFGCKSVEEFIKNHPADLSPPTQPDGTPSMKAAISHIQKAFDTGTDHFFWIHSRMDGTTFPADVLLTRMPLKGREVLQATVRDITELKKTEETIKFQADLLNHVGQAIIMADNNRTIRFWNKAAEKLYGWTEEQALGHKVTDLLGITTPEQVDETSKRLMAGESWSIEALAKNKDGSTMPIILNRTPIYKANGEFLGAASITIDITLQKNIEADLTFSLKSLSNSLDRIQELNEKLRVVGSLTRHDVRNKLSAVTGYAYILKKKHSDLPDIVEGLSRMEQAVQETVKIFDFAKMYEQIGVEELTCVNVAEKIDEAVALFSGPLPTIINECHGLTVLADSFLRQLFYNFIDNTRKYGKKTTTIKVYYGKADQDSLKLVYEDDGVGVLFENKPHLFKEGFSTGGSTGYGLFLTKKMIDVYGWTIAEEGEPSKGAKFTITIPKLSKNGEENYRIVP
jgi:PAS domain S-box-containing protein